MVNGDLRGALGARVVTGGVRFGVYTTVSEQVSVRLFTHDLRERTDHRMRAAGNGYFELTVPSEGHGCLYKFVLDGRELPDPFARQLPHGVHGPAQVIESAYRFRHGAGVHRPLNEQVLYELHVGTFTERGTYRAAVERLPELVELGITTLELMPVATFAGQRGWGYDGVALFAPFAPYGTPDDLRFFVDEAHRLGLGVLLDVVYNHFGPAGNYLAAYSPNYFTRDVQNAWGDAPDYRVPAMRALVLDNARYWLEEFRFDGLRLDAAHAIVDASEPHILAELVREARALPVPKTLIAEDDRNDPSLIERTGLDAVWADDFHHQLRVTLTGEQEGYYAAYQPSVAELAKVIERGWLYEGRVYSPWRKPRGQPADRLRAEAFVYCMQNHDQVGNRALGERLNEYVSLEDYCLASTLLLFLPMTPLLFMGQEWSASTPFLYFTDHEPELGKLVSRGRREEFKSFPSFSDPSARAKIPDPQAFQTFERSRLRWGERARGEHAQVQFLYRALLGLRRTDEVLSRNTRDNLRARSAGNALIVTRASSAGVRLLVANFGQDDVDLRSLGVSAQSWVLLSSGAALDGTRLRGRTAVILMELAEGSARGP